MSWKVGLGHSENDVEIQGDIDFDFFEDDGHANQAFNALHIQPNTSCIEGNGTHADMLANRDDIMVNFSECEMSSVISENVTENPKSVRMKRIERHKKVNGNVSQTSGNSSQNRIAKKVIETIIPNLEEPEVVFKEKDDCIDDAKAEDSGPSSSSVSMSDSDGMSSLSGDLSESESITDVTPLHSPYCCDSPLPQPSVMLNQDKEMEVCERKEAVRFSEDVQWTPEEKAPEPVDLGVLIDAIKKLEVQQQTRRPLRYRPSTAASSSSKLGACRSRKNMSFSNLEVRRIDQENQRLLKCIVSHQTRSKSLLGSSTRNSCLSSSQINRQRIQRQIQMENVALLKRIESAKPSRELSRSLSSQASHSRPSSSLYSCRDARSYSLSPPSDSTASLEIPQGFVYQAVSKRQQNTQ